MRAFAGLWNEITVQRYGVTDPVALTRCPSGKLGLRSMAFCAASAPVLGELA